ncbi:MAG: L,D-transpeptidase family protein [Novosphingobium sp.]
MFSGEPERAPAQPVPAAVRQAKVEPARTEPKQPPVDDRFVIKRILPIDGPIRYGESHWDEAGVAPGPLVITVDLDARVLSVFRGGYEIGATAVLLGTQEKPTPTGVFPITEKKKDHVSNLYDAPMPYMQRLTDDGITLHATNVQNGYASHGCIGMPKDFAKRLFEITSVGDKVYITRGKQVGLGDQIAS